MRNVWNTEPTLLLGAVQAVLALLLAFGVDLTAEQIAAILATTAAVLSVVLRRKVSPVGS